MTSDDLEAMSDDEFIQWIKENRDELPPELTNIINLLSGISYENDT